MDNREIKTSPYKYPLFFIILNKIVSSIAKTPIPISKNTKISFQKEHSKQEEDILSL